MTTPPTPLPYVSADIPATTGYAQVVDDRPTLELIAVTFASIADMPRFGLAAPMRLDDTRVLTPANRGADGFVRWRVEAG